MQKVRVDLPGQAPSPGDLSVRSSGARCATTLAWVRCIRKEMEKKTGIAVCGMCVCIRLQDHP